MFIFYKGDCTSFFKYVSKYWCCTFLISYLILAMQSRPTATLLNACNYQMNSVNHCMRKIVNLYIIYGYIVISQQVTPLKCLN